MHLFLAQKLHGHEKHIIHDLFCIVTLTRLFWLSRFHLIKTYYYLFFRLPGQTQCSCPGNIFSFKVFFEIFLLIIFVFVLEKYVYVIYPELSGMFVGVCMFIKPDISIGP